MASSESLTILLIALGLAMDCFAVSVSRGIAADKDRLRNALALAVSFGAFQAVMPFLGWQMGVGLIDLISGIDHWIAFGLLAVVGVKMMHESRKDEAEKVCKPLSLSLLLMLSFATSIDAFAVGLSFAFLKIDIMMAALLIGVVSFFLAFAGFYLGCRAGKLCGSRAELAGGILLICIGVKILMEHLL
jgi:putative Mn2+ efflux pump MntP